MNQSERDYLYCRGSTAAHATSILVRRTAPQVELDKLVGRVFGHQEAIFFPSDREEEKAFNFSHYFYKECYSPPKIHRGAPDGAILSISDFITEVVDAKAREKRNNLFYLLGDVGVGKTTFVNSLLSNHLRERVESGSMWITRLDVEERSDRKFKTTHELLKLLINKIVYVLRKNAGILSAYVGLREQLQELDKQGMASDGASVDAVHESMVEALAMFVESIRQVTGRRLLLIIDNMDYLLHLNDRNLYSDPEDSNDLFQSNNFCEFVQQFSHGGPFANLAANILVVTRQDSYNLLLQATRCSVPDYTPADLQNYVLEAPHWKSVMNSRAKLLEHAASEVAQPGKRKEFLSLCSLIVDQLEQPAIGGRTLIECLTSLSNFGLRQIMSFYAQYGWGLDTGDGKPYSGFERFAHQTPVAYIAFMLRDHRRFSQFHSHFPNLYLVNVVSAISSVEEFATNAETEFEHSYWLKWLICRYVSHVGDLDPKRIFDVFHHQSGRSYDRHLIAHCLGSLSDANESNILVVARGRQRVRNVNKLRIASVSLSSRGLHVMDELSRRFLYLQLCVDDDLLPLPAELKKEFEFGPLDYGYVIDPNPEYGNSAKKMVAIKARQVLIFVQILKAALKWEEKKYSFVFARLSSAGIVPDVGAWFDSIVDELKALRVSGLDETTQEVLAMYPEIEGILKSTYFPPRGIVEKGV